MIGGQVWPLVDVLFGTGRRCRREPSLDQGDDLIWRQLRGASIGHIDRRLQRERPRELVGTDAARDQLPHLRERTGLVAQDLARHALLLQLGNDVVALHQRAPEFVDLLARCRPGALLQQLRELGVPGDGRNHRRIGRGRRFDRLQMRQRLVALSALLDQRDADRRPAGRTPAAT